MSGTEVLIERLAGEGAAPPRGETARFAAQLAAPLALAALLLAALLGAPLETLERDGPGPMIVKWGISLPLLLVAGVALFAFGHPARSPRWPLALLPIPFLFALLILAGEAAAGGGPSVANSWWRCALAMTGFGSLSFAISMRAMRRFAPVHLRRTGALVGLFAGALAMTAYAPWCTGLGATFLWALYVLPILGMSAAGALIGPRLMRW